MSDQNPHVEHTTRQDVLQIVSTLYGEGPQTAAQIAIDQGWIDANGEATRSGLDLVRALNDQQGTRSVFRPF